jgi:hypothetical protein
VLLINPKMGVYIDFGNQLYAECVIHWGFVGDMAHL